MDASYTSQSSRPAATLKQHSEATFTSEHDPKAAVSTTQHSALAYNNSRHGKTPAETQEDATFNKGDINLTKKQGADDVHKHVTKPADNINLSPDILILDTFQQEDFSKEGDKRMRLWLQQS